MGITLVRVLVLTSVCTLSAKHVFITTPKTWTSAQQYCRRYFTDLSPITSELEDWVFRRSVNQATSGWIGLYRDPNSPTGWKWSGGEYATYQNWVSTSTSNRYYDYVYWTNVGWYAQSVYTYRNFFCLNLIVVEVKKSWEEALEHCRDNHTDLTSMLSKTEHLLAQRVIQKVNITKRVWIGLRYLSDRWMWVNGDPLVYEAWPQGGDQDHQCPIWNHCGTLTKEGLWENWDCQEKLNFICV